MSSIVSGDHLRFLVNRIRERLWVKPLAICLLSIAAAFVAKLADGTSLAELLPTIKVESIETLLSIMAASMLVIATFSVASMVSAYASAGSTATPRSFSLVVADDVSQNALSTFVGAFIFSIVALTAVENNYYGKASIFILFTLTAVVFGLVILTFVRWVDRIARLGRLGSTIDRVEQAAARALKRRREAPNLHGVPVGPDAPGLAVYAAKVGYVQFIDMAALQAWAEDAEVHVVVAALPGTFATPDRPLAYVRDDSGKSTEIDCTGVIGSFEIGVDRHFDDDPRFGLVVLSEIAGRALSPAVNDPGTAIDIVGTLIRLFALWSDPGRDGEQDAPKYERVQVPEVSVRDMFDDAFTTIARDGAQAVEVSVRLQKALKSLAAMGDREMREAAEHHARVGLKRAKIALTLEEDFAVVLDAAKVVERRDDLKGPSPSP